MRNHNEILNISIYYFIRSESFLYSWQKVLENITHGCWGNHEWPKATSDKFNNFQLQNFEKSSNMSKIWQNMKKNLVPTWLQPIFRLIPGSTFSATSCDQMTNYIFFLKVLDNYIKAKTSYALLHIFIVGNI